MKYGFITIKDAWGQEEKSCLEINIDAIAYMRLDAGGKLYIRFSQGDLTVRAGEGVHAAITARIRDVDLGCKDSSSANDRFDSI